jgi:outer membrane protein
MYKRLVALGGIVLACASATAVAQEPPPGPWLVRGRIVNIDPNPSNNATGNGLIASDSIEIDNRWAPEVDISYFFTPNFALELVLTYPQKHDVSWKNSPLTTPPSTVDLGSIKQLPPTLLAQYHFSTGTPAKPYVGAGVTWFYITSNDLTVPGVGDVLNVRESNWGFALQAGLDYALTRNWYLNADVKYIWVETKVTDDIGAGIDMKLKVNPWVYGIGVGYRF